MKILCMLAFVLGILSPTSAVSICKPDLGLVVDTTRSLHDENVPILKKALADLVQKFDISEDKTHVSLETFDRRATVHNRFNDPTFWSVSAVIGLINDNINNLRSPTRLDRALLEANGVMFTEANGDRSGEVNVLVLFTDGRTQDATNFQALGSAVESLRENKDVLLIAVAIGPDSRRMQSQEVLTQIAGENVVYVDNYQNLGDAIDEIFHLICFSICKPDLGLVVDTTRSLGERNLPMLREALANLVQQFDISEAKTHVSLETFHRTATVRNSFNDSTFWSVNAVIGLINDTINNLRSPTRLDRALQMANERVFTEANGDRPGEMNTLVVFTDGRTNPTLTDLDALDDFVRDLKDRGVLLIAVAIGRDSTRTESQGVLRRVAGHVFNVPDFQSFNDAVDDIVNLICQQH